MPRATRSIGLFGIVVATTVAILVVTGALLAVERSNSAARQQRLVTANYETMALARQTLIALQDAEIAERSFLLTGDMTHLQSYETARLRVDALLRLLEAGSRDDGATRRQISEIRAAAGVRLGQLNAAIAAFRQYGRDAPQSADRTEIGQRTIEALRDLTERFITSQRQLLAQRLAAVQYEQDEADLAGLLVLGGAFACLVAGIFMIMRSGVQLERARQQLVARSSLLQTTLETLRDPIFVFDADGTVVAWNRSFAAFARWDPARLPTLTRDYLLSDRSPATRAILQAARIDLPIQEGRQTARVSHGEHEYEVSRGAMSDGGSVIRVAEITDQLRDEAALRQGQKMEALGQLTGGMAHDFNNILQVLQTNLDLVKAGTTDAAALARLRSASAAADHGARLTQQLLAFARRQPLAPQPTHVGRLVSDLEGLLKHAMGERIAIDLAIAPDAGNAKIDPGQLENAILNLAINARDAMSEGGGTVRIAVANAVLDRRYAALHPDVRPGAYVLVDVGDTGTGMPPDVVAHAFDPFFTTKSEGKGTGLGLSMVYGFVQQSSGHIRIDSAIGQGTSVKLYLPRTDEPAVDQSRPEPVGAAHGRERVLVVEDNEDVRNAVMEMLSAWGYRVAAAGSPDEAATLLENDRDFDLLFTDVVMPGNLSAVGLAELARRLRPDIAVLLTSGYARDLIPDAMRSEYPMIAKPYRGEELALRVRQALAVRPRGERSDERSPAGATSAQPTQARRVLVVEDEVVLRMSTTDMLEHLGCEVAGVGSGEEALALLERGDRFDILLTDLGLPGMSGADLADETRRRHPDMPIIIASGYGRTGRAPEGVQFIGKPYSSVDLEQALLRASSRGAVVS